MARVSGVLVALDGRCLRVSVRGRVLDVLLSAPATAICGRSTRELAPLLLDVGAETFARPPGSPVCSSTVDDIFRVACGQEAAQDERDESDSFVDDGAGAAEALHVALEGLARVEGTGALAYCPRHSRGLELESAAGECISAADLLRWERARPTLRASLAGRISSRHVEDDTHYAALLRRVVRAVRRKRDAAAPCNMCAGVLGTFASMGAVSRLLDDALAGRAVDAARRVILGVVEAEHGAARLADATGAMFLAGRVPPGAPGALVLLTRWHAVAQRDIGEACLFVDEAYVVARFGASSDAPPAVDIGVCVDVRPLAVSDARSCVLSAAVVSARLLSISGGQALLDTAFQRAERVLDARTFASVQPRPGSVFASCSARDVPFAVTLSEDPSLGDMAARITTDIGCTAVALSAGAMRRLRSSLAQCVPREISPQRALDAPSSVACVSGLVVSRAVLRAHTDGARENALWERVRAGLPKEGDTLCIRLVRGPEDTDAPVDVIVDAGGRVRLPAGIVPGARVAITHVRARPRPAGTVLVTTYTSSLSVLPVALAGAALPAAFAVDGASVLATPPPRYERRFVCDARRVPTPSVLEGRFLRQAYAVPSGVHALVFSDGTGLLEVLVSDADVSECTRASDLRESRMDVMLRRDWRVTAAPVAAEYGARMPRVRALRIEPVSYADVVNANRFLVD